MYPDRVITIKGSIDNMSAAEAAISTKLRECYEKEMQAPVVGVLGSIPFGYTFESWAHGLGFIRTIRF